MANESEKVETRPIPCATKEQFLAFRARVDSSQIDYALLVALCIAVGECGRIRVIEIHAGERHRGYLIGVRESAKAALYLGRFAVLPYRSARLRIVEERGFVGECQPEELARALADLACKESTVLIQSAPSDSPLHYVVPPLQSMRHVYARAVYPARSRHRLICPLTFDDYLNALSKVTRRTFRHTLRKLREICDGDVVLKMYESPGEAGDFMRDAAPVAHKTWQELRAGRGFKNQAGILRRATLAAELGWFRSFVLFCKGSAVAYIEGYQAAGTWVAFTMGYDPAWRAASVGTACQLEAIRYLIETPNAPAAAIDYLEDDTDLKRRLCNATVLETSIAIAKRTLIHGFLFRAQRTLDGAARIVVRMKKGSSAAEAN